MCTSEPFLNLFIKILSYFFLNLFHQFMHRGTRTHLWWLCFTFSFTLLQFLLCYMNCFFLITSFTEFSIHLLISLRILLPGFIFIYSSKFRAASPRILDCRHRAKISIHPYLKAWIWSAYLYSFTHCFCNDLVKSLHLISVKHNPRNSILCIISSEFQTFIYHCTSFSLYNLYHKLVSHVLRQCLMKSSEKTTWYYVKKKYPLNWNISSSLTVFLHNFFHTDLDFDNYSDYAFSLYYKMSLYIQISAYMHHHNFGFCTGLITPSLLMNETILYMHCPMDMLFLNSFVSFLLLFLYIINL